MIRVLQVTGILNRGGAETMIMNLFRHIDRTRVQFDFVANSLEKGDYEDEICSLGGKVYHCPHYRGLNIFQYIHWWKAFLQEHAHEYSIIHGHIGSAAPIYLYLAKQHGIHAIAHSHNTDEKLLYHLHSLMTRRIADSFFACSQLAGICRFGEAIVSDENRFHVLCNAMDLSKYKYQPEIRMKIRKELEICSDDLVVGHVGRFELQKNHVFIINIFNEIIKIKKNAKLLLIGSGYLQKKIENDVKEKGLEEKVIFTGVRQDVNNLIQAMDIFLFPSLYEGLGIVSIEAQVSGLHVFASTKVPRESDITGLCSFIELGNPQVWAKKILGQDISRRRGYQEECQKAGYDIHETSTWLTDYYYSLAERRNRQE